MTGSHLRVIEGGGEEANPALSARGLSPSEIAGYLRCRLTAYPRGSSGYREIAAVLARYDVIVGVTR